MLGFLRVLTLLKSCKVYEPTIEGNLAYKTKYNTVCMIVWAFAPKMRVMMRVSECECMESKTHTQKDENQL